MSSPQYIPLSAGQTASSNILSPADAGVSSSGTSASTLRTDFDQLGGYLDAIIGSKSTSSVTNDGTNIFGKAYFYNTGSKCSSIVSNNYDSYCLPPDGDSAYEYIYVNTLSQGLMPGVLSGTEKIMGLPVDITDVLMGSASSSCECMPLNVRDSDGTQQCAAAYINSSSVNDSDIKNNICTNDIIDTLYSSGLSGSTSGQSSTSGTSSGGLRGMFNKSTGSTSSKSGGSGLFSSLDGSGFTTMTIQKIYTNLDRFFLLSLSFLLIIILYRIGLK
jgi:hypothetical protein